MKAMQFPKTGKKKSFPLKKLWKQVVIVVIFFSVIIIVYNRKIPEGQKSTIKQYHPVAALLLLSVPHSFCALQLETQYCVTWSFSPATCSCCYAFGKKLHKVITSEHIVAISVTGKMGEGLAITIIICGESSKRLLHDSSSVTQEISIRIGD